MTKYAIAHGEKFKIVDEVEEEICVECEFDFYFKPHKRILKLWWYRDSVDEIIEEEGQCLESICT